MVTETIKTSAKSDKILNPVGNFKLLSYCFQETIGFAVNASFARGLRLIKPGDVTNEF